jgi:hypothetical protein
MAYDIVQMSATYAQAVQEGTIIEARICGAADLDCNEALPGRGAFRDPGEMWVDSEATLEFAVAMTNEGVARELGESDAPSNSRDINIGRCMRVTLEPNPAIRIVGANGETKRLGRDMNRASWSWSVMPLREGESRLRGRVEVLAQRDGRCTEQVLDQYTERVQVRIQISTWKSLLRSLGEAKNLGDVLKALFSSWEGAVLGLVALITALGTLYATVFRKRRRRQLIR